MRTINNTSGQPISSTESDLQTAMRLFVGFGQSLGNDNVTMGTDSGLYGNSPNGYSVMGNLGEYASVGTAQSNQQAQAKANSNNLLLLAAVGLGAWYLLEG